MDINLTLIGQTITFAIFVWFTMKFVWPPLMALMEDRRSKIADGLAAAEQGQLDLETAQEKVRQVLADAKTQAGHILEQANHRSNHIVEEAKKHAREEGERLLQLAQGEIGKSFTQAKEQLIQEISGLAISGAEKILQREVDKSTNGALVEQLVAERLA